MHVRNYVIVSGLRLHVGKFCKRLPAKKETMLFTRVIVSPLVPTEMISLAEKACQIWSNYLGRFKSYG